MQPACITRVVSCRENRFECTELAFIITEQILFGVYWAFKSLPCLGKQGKWHLRSALKNNCRRLTTKTELTELWLKEQTQIINFLDFLMIKKTPVFRYSPPKRAHVEMGNRSEIFTRTTNTLKAWFDIEHFTSTLLHVLSVCVYHTIGYATVTRSAMVTAAVLTKMLPPRYEEHNSKKPCF